jgi:protein-disulfide isomerase
MEAKKRLDSRRPGRRPARVSVSSASTVSFAEAGKIGRGAGWGAKLADVEYRAHHPSVTEAFEEPELTSNNSVGGALIVASIMISIAVLGSGYFVSQSLDRATRQLREVALALEDLPDTGGARAAAPGARPARPDPAKRYDVSVGEAPRRGGEDATVTIVEFSDFQCPFCGRVRPTLDKIRAEYGDDVVIAFKHLPLSIHPKAPAAHAAAEAAHRQGQFWAMHDHIFGSQQDMSPEKYREYAQAMGLDMAKFDQDVASAAVKSRIESDAREAALLGVTGTPSFFVNGRFLSGAQPFESFKRLIDEELKKG